MSKPIGPLRSPAMAEDRDAARSAALAALQDDGFVVLRRLAGVAPADDHLGFVAGQDPEQ